MTWKWLLLALLPLTAGCADSGAVDPAATISAPPPAPPASVTLSTYGSNLDADADEELVAYIELFDDRRAPTACDCNVSFEVAARDSSRWTLILQEEVGRADFHETTVGRGTFARDALVWSTGLDDEDLPCYSSTSSFKVRVTVTLGSRTLQDEDTAFC